MTHPAPPIFLIGYRGSGKSTVAELLAVEMELEAVDSDRLVEAAAGKTIAQLFSDAGEPAFRDAEEKVVAELCNRDNIVAALGGGAILRETTRERIASTGLVIWLKASLPDLTERLSADTATAAHRPSLTGASVTDEIAHVLAERQPLYEACADLVIDTSGLTPRQVTAAVLDLVSAETDDAA